MADKRCIMCSVSLDMDYVRNLNRCITCANDEQLRNADIRKILVELSAGKFCWRPWAFCESYTYRMDLVPEWAQRKLSVLMLLLDSTKNKSTRLGNDYIWHHGGSHYSFRLTRDEDEKTKM